MEENERLSEQVPVANTIPDKSSNFKKFQVLKRSGIIFVEIYDFHL
jgi:hypothetical protein